MNSRELLAKLKSKTSERLDEWRLFNDSRTIQSIYQTAGYPQAVVKLCFENRREGWAWQRHV